MSECPACGFAVDIVENGTAWMQVIHLVTEESCACVAVMRPWVGMVTA